MLLLELVILAPRIGRAWFVVISGDEGGFHLVAVEGVGEFLVEAFPCVKDKTFLGFKRMDTLNTVI